MVIKTVYHVGDIVMDDGSLLTAAELENYSIVTAQDFNITDGVFYSEGFLGLLDGRNTWKNVCKYDSDAKDSFAGYPAYKYAVNYGIDNGFKKFQKGWYLPTASEAVELAFGVCSVYCFAE